MTVADVQAVLAERGLQAAVAAPWPSATVGGLIAANINGPARMRYGSLRDNLLCATVALADGRVIHAGRPLVKNVAGYDLPKVFVGSWGTLGLLTDVTLKLTPLPAYDARWWRRWPIWLTAWRWLTLPTPKHLSPQGSSWCAQLTCRAWPVMALRCCIRPRAWPRMSKRN